MPGPNRPPADVVVGVDVGTTAVKVVAFAVGGAWRHLVQREYALAEPRPGTAVQDADVVVDATVEALRACVAAVPADDTVLGLSLSTAMHGLLGVDAEGAPLTPLVTWADARAGEDVHELHRSGLTEELHQRSGTPVHPMSPLAKLLWFRRCEPRTWARVRHWVGLKEHLLRTLTGRLVTELSSASATGLLDRRSATWSAATLALCGLEEDRLAPVHPTTAVLPLSPDVARQVGLPGGLPVVLGAADGPLANLGTGAVGPGVLGLSLGTSGAARMVVPQPDVLPRSLFCYALTQDAWVLGGAVSNGGVVVRWAAHALAPELRRREDLSVDEQLLQLAATVPAGAEGLVVLPYLLPERAPLWDPDVPGAVLGLRRAHTRAHLARGAVEGVALQLGAIASELDRLHPVRAVRATGGAFRGALWREVVAAVLDRPLEVVGAAEGTALGAAALGLHALGRADRLEDAPALLDLPGGEAHEDVVPDPALVPVYRTARERLPELVVALQAVAGVVAAPDRSTSPPAHG